MNDSFPCIQCGLCCQKLDKVAALEEYNRGDGVCRHLTNNLCGIYERRPLLCNVTAMYDTYFSKDIDKETFFRKNLFACLELAKGNPETEARIKTVILQAGG